jgi:serine protease SohB
LFDTLVDNLNPERLARIPLAIYNGAYRLTHSKSSEERFVTDFLWNYGLFAAKILTFSIIILGVLLFLASLLSGRSAPAESIEIEKINDQFDMMRETLEDTILSKAELKKLKKERKKEEQLTAKKAKLATDAQKKRLFVLRFEGDLQASDVTPLRQAITAVLLVATPEDEVVVILESSGGYVHHYGLAASQLQRIRAHHIPLTVSIDLVAASGGYMMASVANHIIAAPFAVVGSIGVLAQIPNFNRLLKKYDIDIEQHTAGEYKTTLTMLGENTPKAREKFKEELEDTHALFKAFVHENRPILNINHLATGEHWYGSTALELKLIDEISSSDDYLMRKSKACDIFEVSYVIHQGLVDKVIAAMHGTTAKLSRLLGIQL